MANTTIVLSQTGSDSTGNGSASNPYKTLQGVKDAGKLNANTTIMLTRGGSYGRLDVGSVPANMEFRATGTGPAPIVTGIGLYAASANVPGFLVENLHVVGSGGQNTGIDILNRGDVGGTGLSGAKIVGCEVEQFDLGISMQSANDTGRHNNFTIDHCYVHDNGTLGILLGGFDIGLIKDTVTFHNGQLSVRGRDQAHGIYGQAHYARNCTNVTYNNCAALDSTGCDFRGTGGKFNGQGSKLSYILAMLAGTHIASEEGLDSMDHVVAITTRDPTSDLNPNDKNNGCGLHLDHSDGATISFCVFAGGGNGTGSDASLGQNIHALQFDGCKNLTVSDVVVYDYQKGDCWGPSNEVANGNNKLNRVTFVQPDARWAFTNGGGPISANWIQSPPVAMSRTPMQDHRATIARVLGHAGVSDLRGLATWLAADPTRIRETITWTQAPYFSVTPPFRSADLNGDGVINVLDFNMFQNLFAAGDMRADFNNDGILNVLDFAAFLNAVAAQRPS